MTETSSRRHVTLNADGARGMRVEVSDDRFALLPQYGDRNSGSCAADGGLDCPVTWPGPDLSALEGKTVRLRVHLKRQEESQPRLYAITLSE